ncbi:MULTISPECIES: bifunctional phosphoribosyl-AMP cyclohydrolase/phosphoribosyl-ATP diphosphatase HisIE [Carboxydocella]|uniref:Histidine biosynthesis bifunctional protein HisIE n=2 Tax=Carboxydocella TaxID=178898 RepID=A0A1T4R7B4_9FIRM|nr:MULTISPECIES: bifunctional phosphoribosyl-AMP cyclohydrolase/phosphoribosyl-ATP diphosphatase HisIE [Carboxydocella]AVX19401.1 phosphoribosyl-ATP pyrophosphatase /phosphoribosyl-AMP cyclohydrolase [Carboxydocella thermautotrophica]AVX29815.1 phosphoribosyl-ATP pyrophosphatase /phosphoribosyl-AMP cyclohydrolase [Carboxydocella thermautotrophica]SKA11568.1 phosphoribosyl-ATP pyrophosphatase /phosphoribosyl-AMP cyclohydrolase [Carboxydocella sporoproducens DSM 16521]GAW29114.1 bifunctional phos
MKQKGIQDLQFGPDGLLPAIVQDVHTREVLMLAYMNRQALERTLATGRTWFWSRSRQQLWNKGETSGHYQLVREIAYDCDADALLIKVEQVGVACHTGEYSCFHNRLSFGEREEQESLAGSEILVELWRVIKERQETRPEGSYTAKLFNQGLDKILKKVGEEAAEVIIAAKNRQPEEVAWEAADLIYHLWVLLAEQGMEPARVYRELAKRR